MKEFLMVVALLTVFRSPRPIYSVDVVHIKSASSAAKIAPAEPRTAATNNESASAVLSAKSSKSADDAAAGNGTTPCDRYLRSTEVEVRNPKNHKFVTSNGWTDRQRPRPEINVYSRIEELPSSTPPPPPPPPLPAGIAAYYQQQRDNFYQQSRQQLQPTVRTSKRIIYYATLPDVVRTPIGYPPPSPQPPSYSSDPFAISPGPFSADFRQLDSNKNNGPSPADHLQRNRVAPYENAYNRGGVTSVTTKSTAVFNSRYDEPAEFRDSFYRPNDFSSKFASWAEPFYKSWTSSSWDKDPVSRFSNRDSSPYPWYDREPLGGSLWDTNRGASWDSHRGSPWDSNRGSSWEKELVEVPLQKPNGGGDNGRVRADGGETDNKYNPEVAVVQSGVIDVRGDRQQISSSPPPPPPPPSRFTIIDVDPKPYQPEHLSMRYDDRKNSQQPPHNMLYDPPAHVPQMRYDQPQKPSRYETYTPMQPPTRYEPDQPPPSMQRFEQQYTRPPVPPSSYSSSSSSSSSTQHGQQNPNKQSPNGGYYGSVKNNINTHQFMTSWTEVLNQNDVSPTNSVSLDISSLGNSTSVHNNTRIVPYMVNNNSTKMPK